MKYINRQNGSVIDTNSKLGGVWEAVKPSNTKPVDEDVKVEEPKKATKRKK